MTEPRPTPVRPLTPKQQRFVAEYAIDLNATQAAIRAGYSEKTARAIGSENLTKPDIAAALSTALAEPLERAEWDVARIVVRAGQIAMEDRNDRVPALMLLSKRFPEFRDNGPTVNVGVAVTVERRTRSTQ